MPKDLAYDDGGYEIDMDDRLVAIGIPEDRRNFDQVVPHGDHGVRFLERLVHMVAALQPHGEQAMRVGHGDGALAHEGVDDRDAGFVGEVA